MQHGLGSQREIAGFVVRVDSSLLTLNARLPVPVSHVNVFGVQRENPRPGLLPVDVFGAQREIPRISIRSLRSSPALNVSLPLRRPCWLLQCLNVRTLIPTSPLATCKGVSSSNIYYKYINYKGKEDLSLGSSLRDFFDFCREILHL